jgi:hypothetical protein
MSTICLSLSSQNIIIPRNANTVIIYQGDNKITFDQTLKLLFDNGYSVLAINKETGIISTEEKTFINGIIKLNLMIGDSLIILRGSFKSDLSIEVSGVKAENTWEIISYRGQRKSIARNAWDEIMKIASAFPGDKKYLMR